MMSLKTTCFIALFAALFASEHLIISLNSSCSKYFVHLLYLTASLISPIVSALSIPNDVHHKQEFHYLLSSGIPPRPEIQSPTSLCVDKEGTCNFTEVQAAVDAVPKNSPNRTVILIKRGIYYEKLVVRKHNITFQGEGHRSTIISWNDTARSSNGTRRSASVLVTGANFIAKNISFRNSAPYPKPGAVGGQAVALSISGDKSAFWGCGFYGFQDTLNDDKGRHYFKDCLILGTVDFIYGNGRSFYETCRLISLSREGQSAYITAHGRNNETANTGYAFVKCTIEGTGKVWLGRDWRPFARVVFAYTNMSDIIPPAGWIARNPETVFYGEYECSGPGANMTSRNSSFVHNLNDIEVSPFLTVSYIDGVEWLKPFNTTY